MLSLASEWKFENGDGNLTVPVQNQNIRANRAVEKGGAEGAPAPHQLLEQQKKFLRKIEKHKIFICE